jgi:hypothetical protein
MTCAGPPNCVCGCCAGTGVQTPQMETNRPGLNALAYRAGTWSSFKASMLARLSSSDYPALQLLRTRADDDFTIALLDASALVLDILSFYQERLINESYLRTATQLRSLTELSRLIDYEPRPGVAAATYLAFSLRQTPGQPPDPAAAPITIPKGTQVQSVPPPGQQPQTFETAADIPAKPDWTALQVRTGSPWTPARGDKSVYLAGTATQLQPGDLFLVVGKERAGNPLSEVWDVRVVATVVAHGQNNRTLVTWQEGLGSPSGGVSPTHNDPKFYVFRQRAALFGYNAIQPILLNQRQLNTLKMLGLLTIPSGSLVVDWNFRASQSPANNNLDQQSLIDLDAVYSKIVPQSWIALIQPEASSTRSPAGIVTLYKVNSVTTMARADFGASAKISRIAVDANTDLINYYNATRATSALAQSEQLAPAEQPLAYPLYGAFVELEDLRPDLMSVTAVALSGKRQKIAVVEGVSGLSFIPSDGSQPMVLNPGDTLTLTDPAALPLNPDGSINPDGWRAGRGSALSVEDASGRPGTVSADIGNYALISAGPKDPIVTEFALVAAIAEAPSPFPHSVIQLQSNLLNCYERTSTTVNANVGLATAGASVTEVMGSGNAATVDQSFTLRQAPLTYTQAPTSSGMQSTLQVRINGIAWSEVPTLYQQPPTAQVFATFNDFDGKTDVRFGGDGEGSILPSGQNNLIASYRIGSGAAGNVAAGTITTLADRPLGVAGVTNPQDATGGQDPESIEDIRSNAPRTVLTLGRAVSITDYQNFAASYPGIAKAYAVWIPSGVYRGVFLTIAGVNGQDLTNSPTLVNLAGSLHNYGNPLIPITLRSFVETLFGFSAAILYDPVYDQPAVEADVSQALTQAFSFAARSFGQAVSLDEIAATIQGVPGVIATNVAGLQRTGSSAAGGLANLAAFSTIARINRWIRFPIGRRPPITDSSNLLCAALPVASPDSPPQPAELLLLDPRPGAVALTVMS